MKHSVRITLTASSGRLIHLPGLSPIQADSQQGRKALRLIKDAVEARNRSTARC